MNRRKFLSATAAAAVAAGATARAGTEKASELMLGGNTRSDLYELRRYIVEPDNRLKRTFKSSTAERRERLNEFLGKVMVPALNRAGIKPVGAFESRDGSTTDIYLLLTYPVAELLGASAILTTTDRLLADKTFLADGKKYLECPQDDPLYSRVESTVMVAFDGWPRVKPPASDKNTNVYQMRIYESHSELKAARKREMFNRGGEIDLFLKCGVQPVFFGQAVAGPILPNLTYMITFPSADAQKAAWDKFRKSPEWAKMKSDPRYKETVSHITNLELKALSYSQV